jgi:kinesin family member 15
LADSTEKFALLNGLEAQIKSLTQENEKLMESIASRDMEWETAIVDLSRFLSSSCDSLEDASDSIDSLVSAFPKRESVSLVNSHVERAIRASLERERVVHDLREKLNETRRLERGLKRKLDCLRGATLAMSELHQRELLEGIHGPGVLKVVHTSPHEVFSGETPFDKVFI